VLRLSITYYYKYFLLITRVHIKGNNVLRPTQLLDFSDAHPQTMPTTRARVILPLFLPQGAQIEIEYNLLDIDPFAAPHTSRHHTPYPILEDPSSEFYGLTYNIKGK